jgi:uncharacterized membrane-anchored protein
MINTIKILNGFLAVSFLCVLLGVFTFITFINQNFIFLNENNLQYLLILDVALLVIFLIMLIRETSKIFYEYKSKTLVQGQVSITFYSFHFLLLYHH